MVGVQKSGKVRKSGNACGVCERDGWFWVV